MTDQDLIYCQPFKCKLSRASCVKVQRGALKQWALAQANKGSKRVPSTGVLVKLAACAACKWGIPDIKQDSIRTEVVRSHRVAIEYINKRIHPGDVLCEIPDLAEPARNTDDLPYLRLDPIDSPLQGAEDMWERRLEEEGLQVIN